jgi:hypothetical protein
MKTTLVHIRLEDEKLTVLDALAGPALNRQAVARMLLIAAIDAIQLNQGRLHFPPRFEVPSERFDLNDPKPSTYKRK